MQTKFELMGVAGKSLDRANSQNTDINWTDGLHLRYQWTESGWKSHLILEYNSPEGSSSVTRKPLDFSDSSTRVTSFLMIENKKPWGNIVQRSFGVTYMNNALLADANNSTQREDYINLVSRLAAKWSLGFNSKSHLLIAIAGGYAINTPDTIELGKTGNWAGQSSINLIDFFPKHSLGFLYGYTEGGWLISPDFRPNNQLLELRYRWKITKHQKFEVRVRWREDLKLQDDSSEHQVDKDFYLRYSFSF